ncbi:MAG: hypothetical protein AAGU11_17180, partial [Syntrophobacteraceae bacterium]
MDYLSNIWLIRVPVLDRHPAWGLFPVCPLAHLPDQVRISPIVEDRQVLTSLPYSRSCFVFLRDLLGGAGLLSAERLDPSPYSISSRYGFRGDASYRANAPLTVFGNRHGAPLLASLRKFRMVDEPSFLDRLRL